MSKTHGRSPLPIPQALDVALRGLGMTLIPEETPALYRCPTAPDVWLWVARSNMPGSDDVSFTLRSKTAGLMGFESPDKPSLRMERVIAASKNPNQKMSTA